MLPIKTILRPLAIGVAKFIATLAAILFLVWTFVVAAAALYCDVFSWVTGKSLPPAPTYAFYLGHASLAFWALIFMALTTHRFHRESPAMGKSPGLRLVSSDTQDD